MWQKVHLLCEDVPARSLFQPRDVTNAGVSHRPSRVPQAGVAIPSPQDLGPPVHVRTDPDTQYAPFHTES